jgi:hypothetical protein
MGKTLVQTGCTFVQNQIGLSKKPLLRLQHVEFWYKNIS